MAHIVVGPGQVAQGCYHLVALRLVQSCDGSGHAAFLIFWRHGLLAAAIAAIGGGLTELPHMCTCSDLVNRRPSWPRSMMYFEGKPWAAYSSCGCSIRRQISTIT